MYRSLHAAPASSLPAERRGRLVGKFCRVCQAVYPALAARHAGKPVYGKDHVSSPCACEGRRFEAGADWWEPAVEALEAPAAPPSAA